MKRRWKPSPVQGPYFTVGKIRWYERMMAVNPMMQLQDSKGEGLVDDEGAPILRPLNRAERRGEARLSRLHGDGRKRGGIIDQEMIDKARGKDSA